MFADRETRWRAFVLGLTVKRFASVAFSGNGFWDWIMTTLDRTTKGAVSADAYLPVVLWRDASNESEYEENESSYLCHCPGISRGRM